MTEQCLSCQNFEHCHTKQLNPYLRGEDCQFWQLGQRFGVRCCWTCLRYDGDECKLTDRLKSASGYCDEWEPDK